MRSIHEPLLESDRIISRKAEQLMRRSALIAEIRQRKNREQAFIELAQQLKPYLAISRQTGAGGTEIAREVGRRLGWPVLGRVQLETLAEQSNMSHAMVDLVDETAYDWLIELFGKWFDSQVLTQSEYVAWLGRVALHASQQASTVFVGRGLQYLLPRNLGLAVRVVAPLRLRVERIMRQRQLDLKTARRFIAHRDLGRRAFIKNYFHQDVNDAKEYDLVLNRHWLSFDEIVETIVTLCQRHFPHEPLLVTDEFPAL